MEQEGTENGRLLEVEITESLPVRAWLSFVAAKYEFVQQSDSVQVIRTDVIESRLRPRWYWHWFENQCVRLEHCYVMQTMKRKAESGSRD